MGKGIRKTLNNRPKQYRRKTIVLGSEGNNKTETLYFSELERKHNRYHFIFVNSNDTDPCGIINATAIKAKLEKIDRADGDIAVAIFDLDLNQNKIKDIDKTINLANNKKVELYTSNPCFELWYLLHFAYTTSSYSSNNELLNRLKRYIPNYEKDKCNFDVLNPLTKNAIKNATKMKEQIKKTSKNKNHMIDNPNTDVDILVSKVLDN